jgi:hypothetical protein
MWIVINRLTLMAERVTSVIPVFLALSPVDIVVIR